MPTSGFILYALSVLKAYQKPYGVGRQSDDDCYSYNEIPNI
jgi:hypothetical protein